MTGPRLTRLLLLLAPMLGAGGSVSAAFPIHAFHRRQLGALDCSDCHAAAKDGSVMLKRPGHEQCAGCHADDFGKDLRQKLCAECHSTFPPTGSADLLPYPSQSAPRAILLDFSHKLHVDTRARVDPKTGFRADCTFCHRFDAKGQFATFPSHEQCATCHSKPGMRPRLTTDLSVSGCLGCHAPETTQKAQLPFANGRYPGIAFSHVAHFREKARFDLDCTTCHYAIPASTAIEDAALPRMVDCVQCHGSARLVKPAFRIANCGTCHLDSASGKSALPGNHTLNVKPEFHNESFRLHHADQAAAPGANCYACHQNVTASAAARLQCDSCHQAMRPASHTARWKDDLHGKYASLDRSVCATCHSAAYCSDCHNELPRSHNPLPLFKGGAHAFAARLDTRKCFTCHTFANTCSECHVNRIAQNKKPERARSAAARSMPPGVLQALLR